jgi:hypothetical protein
MVLATLVGAMSAGAQTVDLSLESDTAYDSNVFNTEDEQASGVFRFNAPVAVYDELERASYRVSYEPSFLVYSRDGGDSAWNHRGYGEGTYNLTQRTEVTLTDSFTHSQRIRQAEGGAPTDPNVNQQGDRTLTRNTVSLAIQHLLSQRLSTNLAGEYTIYEYSDGRQEDSSYIGGSGGVNYLLTERTSIGGGAAMALRSFDPSPKIPLASPFCPGESLPGTRSVSTQAYASIAHRFSETTRISVRGGPAQIDSKSSFCGLDPNFPSTFVMRASNTNLTWFAEVSAQKSWKLVSASATYRRSEGVAGSGSGSSINDLADAHLSWKIDQRWHAKVTGSWLRRSSTGISADALSQDLTTWRAQGQLSRALSERLRTTLSVTYIDQSSSGGGIPGVVNSTTGFKATQVNFAITYRFEPWRF